MERMVNSFFKGIIYKTIIESYKCDLKRIYMEDVCGNYI